MTLPSNIIKACLDECRKSTYKVHIGCVIYKGKRILSKGHNQIRASKISNSKWPNSLHAEIDALRKLYPDWNKLKGAKLLVIKLSKTQELLSNARPCTNCFNFIQAIGIKDIYFSNEHGGISYRRI